MEKKAKYLSHPEDLPKIYQIQIKNKMKKGKSYEKIHEYKNAIEQFIGAN